MTRSVPSLRSVTLLGIGVVAIAFCLSLATDINAIFVITGVAVMFTVMEHTLCQARITRAQRQNDVPIPPAASLVVSVAYGLTLGVLGALIGGSYWWYLPVAYTIAVSISYPWYQRQYAQYRAAKRA